MPTDAQLIAQIESAFANVPRKHGITLHEAEAIDDAKDRREARAKDTDANWQDVPEAWLDEIDAAPFLDPLGLRYYLPAYMRMIVRRGRAHFSGFTGPYGFLAMLADPPRALVDLLDPQQRQVVADFLAWAAEDGEFADEARAALPRWHEIADGTRL